MEGYLAQDVLPTGVRRRLGARSFVLPLVLLAEIAGGVGLRGAWEVMTPDTPAVAAVQQPGGKAPGAELPAVTAPPAVPDAMTVPGPVPSPVATTLPVAPVVVPPAPAQPEAAAPPVDAARNPFAPGG